LLWLTVLSEDVVDPGMGRLKCIIYVGVVEYFCIALHLKKVRPTNKKISQNLEIFNGIVRRNASF
jgi:hypothetical protein